MRKPRKQLVIERHISCCSVAEAIVLAMLPELATFVIDPCTAKFFEQHPSRNLLLPF